MQNELIWLERFSTLESSSCSRVEIGFVTSLCLLYNLWSLPWLRLIGVHDMHTSHCVFFLQECLRKLQIKPWWSIFAQDAPRPQGVFVPLCMLGGWEAWWSCCVTEPSGMSNQYKATESWLPQLSWVFKMNNIKPNLKVACKKVALTKSMSHIWFKILH